MEDKILVNLGTDHTYECATDIIGREGEGSTTQLQISIPEKLIGCSVYLDFEKSNGEKLRTPKLKIENGKAVYDVVQYLLTDDGELKVQAVLITGDSKIWKSSKKTYHIQDSINALEEIPDKEDFMSEAQRVLDELSGEIEALAEMLANDEDFVDAVARSFDGYVEEKVGEVNNELTDTMAKLQQLKPEFANSIEECTDTSKLYVLPDGYIYAYTTFTTAGGEEEETEQITGEFLEGNRLSTSSGDLRTDVPTAITTPLIDISCYGDNFTIHLEGTGASSVQWASTTTDVTGNSICLYKDGKFATGGYTGRTAINGVTYVVNASNDVDVIFDKTTATKEFNQVRFSGVTGKQNNTSVFVTYEVTTEGGTEQRWANTGHAFVPADYEDRIVKLETDNAGLKSKVKALENTAIYEERVPSYVVEEAEKVADKVLAVRNANSFVMAFASDFHTTGEDTSSVSVLHAGQGMDAVNSMAQLDLVALLGDYEIYYFDDGAVNTDKETEDARKSFKHVKKCFNSVSKGVPTLWLQGNHDKLTTGYDADKAQTSYAYIGANNIGTVTDYANKFRNYGYRDFGNYKIRVIYLNTTDVSGENVTTDCWLSSSQMGWFINTALNFTDKPDWSFIVLTHHPLNWSNATTPLLTVLNAYKGKTSGSVTINGTGVSYNFASVTAELIAHFHGHLHNFRAETLGTNKVPTITIPNACFDRNNEYGTASSYSDDIKATFGDTDESGKQQQFNKKDNTSEDTAFNVIVIDKDACKIHCFNYGAGIDREIIY